VDTRNEGGAKTYALVTFMVILIGFSYSFFAISIQPRVSEIGVDQFWLYETLPLLYWIGLIMSTIGIFSMIRFLKKSDALYPFLFIFSSVLLMINLRMVWPVISKTPVLYEPDANNYITVVNSWLKSGIDFGVEGNYQHDYPLSFLIAFISIKLGIPMDIFFRFSPLFIYTIDAIILYLLYHEIAPERRLANYIAIFLFSLSSLGYWTSVHYCPDLVGTVFYLLSLFLCVKYVRKTTWKTKIFLLIPLSIFLLILSHHLSTLYLALTLLGLSFSMRLNQSTEIKKKWILFFVSGIYTYTLWFAYGSLVYPSFFNIYVYLQYSGSPITLAIESTLFDNLTFVIYPAFVFMLFAYGILKGIKVKRGLFSIEFYKRLLSGKVPTISDTSITYFTGYIFVAILFVLGFGIPNSYPLRVLEVLLIGIYPIAGQTFIQMYNANPSRKLKAILFCITIFVMLTSVYRYNRQIQRRATAAI